jgi:hypothetical protein
MGVEGEFYLNGEKKALYCLFELNKEDSLKVNIDEGVYLILFRKSELKEVEKRV